MTEFVQVVAKRFGLCNTYVSVEIWANKENFRLGELSELPLFKCFGGMQQESATCECLRDFRSGWVR